MQNHDQVGNRARGERISHLVSHRRALLGSALVLLGPFVPMLFQGEEWAARTPFQYFTDHQDPTLGAAVRDGRRREFQAFGWDPKQIPDPQAIETFEASRLNFSELELPEHAEVLHHYRTLIALRRSVPELQGDAVRVSCDEQHGWLCLQRAASVVAVNFAPHEQRVPFALSGDARLLHGSSDVRLEASAAVLPPESYAVVVCRAP